MGIPAGLSNFTGAFMQAYQGTKDKQTQDARQRAQDDMNKQQFDTLQQARKLDIADAIKAGQEHDVDRAAAEKKKRLADLIDNSKRNVIGAFAQGDMHGALSGIEDYIAKDPNAPGKLVFARDANGKIAISPDGKATGNYVDASGKVIRSVNETPQDIVAGFNARVNPDNYLKDQDEAAKDNRKLQQEKELESLKNYNAMNLERFKSGQERAKQGDLIRYYQGRDKADNDPVYALAIARLNPIYKTVKDSESASSMIQSLRANPQVFFDDYVKAKQAYSADHGIPVKPTDIGIWQKEASDLAGQIGILPPTPAYPTPTPAPGATLPPMPQPYIPPSAKAAQPKPGTLTDQKRKSILDEAWGTK